MSLCTEDYLGDLPETLAEWLTEAWNKRAASRKLLAEQEGWG
jgi:hypothetical protein